MRVVFATSEVSPIAKTGGLGDVCGSLPKELARLGHDVTVFMPYYRQAKEWFRRAGIEPEVVVPPVWMSWGTWAAEVAFLRAKLPGSEVPLILVANDFYYDREQIYFGDDYMQRYTVFCRAVIRGCQELGIAPEILHCHDWHTALLPLYLHSGLRGDALFRATRSVYTIHNLNYQGVAGPDAFPLTGLHGRYWAPDALEHFGTMNPMKGGIIFADQVTTVSPNYAREVQTTEHGAGLDGVLRAVSYKFTGVVNGIDTGEWNPATDKYLPANYDRENMEGKARVKRALQKEAGLPASKAPILAIVSRMVDQKGFHLVLPILGRLLDAGAQATILGSGESWLEQGFQQMARMYPQSCRVWIGFDNALAHRIYGGCDLLLMPSIYEPCGLNQMYSLRYGSLPVVRMTGGLVDTVTPFDGSNRDVATGFGFFDANAESAFYAAWAGMLVHRDGKLWKQLEQNGMRQDFSWGTSAAQYVEIYRRASFS